MAGLDGAFGRGLEEEVKEGSGEVGGGGGVREGGLGFSFGIGDIVEDEVEGGFEMRDFFLGEGAAFKADEVKAVDVVTFADHEEGGDVEVDA
jgi:hypothetical protein